MIEQKKMLTAELKHYRELYEERGGENDIISKKIEDGVILEKEPWEIRRQIIALKNEVKDMEEINKRQNEFEKRSSSTIAQNRAIPQRKRVPMIPLKMNK